MIPHGWPILKCSMRSVLSVSFAISFTMVPGVLAAVTVQIKALEDMKKELLMTLAKGSCRNITREEVHQLIDEIYEEYAG